MGDQCCSNDEGHDEQTTIELPEHFSRLAHELPGRPHSSIGLSLPRAILDEVVKTLKPEEWDLNTSSKINLSNRGAMDRVHINKDGVKVDLGPAGAVAAVLGTLLLAAAGRGDSEGDSERVREAEREAKEARRVQKQERMAREKAQRQAEEARLVQEQERLAREEAERKEKLERSLRELGVPPEREISETDICNARLEAGYLEGSINIVLVGNRGMGKSTLINSLRGLSSGDPGTAKVGEVETTSKLAKYADSLHKGIVWYDVPGAGTDKTTAWQYYYNQKLFIFDEIVLVHDTTLTESDLRILKLCKYRNQECIVVRSKADMHIRNRARRLRLDSQTARQGYIREVKEDTDKCNTLIETGSPEELTPSVTDYIVSEMGVLRLVTDSKAEVDPLEQVINERSFLQKLGLEF